MQQQVHAITETVRSSVLLVEDDAMVRGWLEFTLEESEFHVTGTARTAEQAAELIERRRPDLLLIDYRLPGRRGTELVRELRRAGLRTPALLMTANAEPGFNELAREAGAQGSVLKTGSTRELLDAMRAIRSGENWFDPRYPARPRSHAALSPREREVLQHVAAGHTNREIAAILGIGDESVKTLLGRACSKLGTHRRAEAVAAAHELGLL